MYAHAATFVSAAASFVSAAAAFEKRRHAPRRQPGSAGRGWSAAGGAAQLHPCEWSAPSAARARHARPGARRTSTPGRYSSTRRCQAACRAPPVLLVCSPGTYCSRVLRGQDARGLEPEGPRLRGDIFLQGAVRWRAVHRLCCWYVVLVPTAVECCAGKTRAAWSPRDLDSGEIFFYKALSGGVPCTACAAAECCAGKTRAAWSPKDLDSGEIFFYKALSGGVPCTACAAESCKGVQCGAGRRCAVRDGRARCVCAATCRRAGPVCGSDGKTYKSLCRLRRRSCRRPAKHLTLDYPGPCRGKFRRTGDPYRRAGPICGAMGRQTYKSLCRLRRTSCRRPAKHDTLDYPGPCREQELFQKEFYIQHEISSQSQMIFKHGDVL
ncbi:kazal-type serine protease inhibitor domain-containing protein [Phthorimaea operculella]|nr:kazal-type serine protease inhibitor domain-containing protein [Phthorimaea operculella]